VLAAVAAANAHDPITTKLTWTQEISRIFYRRCLTCHREGGAAPMPLATYEQARPWAKAIRDEVLERRMPPWGAVKGFGEFRNDPSLSEPEIDSLVHWVEGGVPEGNPVYLPDLPPAAPESNPQPNSGELELPLLLRADVEALSIRATGPVEVIAHAPGGAARHLIWVRELAEPRVYEFRRALRLTKGTRIEVFASRGARAFISARKPAR